MKIKRFLIIIFLMFLCNINMVYAKEKVEFSKCVDGDTIKVLVDGKEQTVRMLAVDTPESVHPTKGVEYYGKEASNFTCDKVTNAKKIELEYDENSDKTDKYDRLLAWVFVDGELLQDLLVSGGYAEVDYLYGDYKYTSLLKDHQAVVETKNIGIWNDEARETYVPDNSKKTNNNEGIDLENLTIDDIWIIILAMIVSVAYSYINKKYKKVKNKLKIK